MPIDKIAFRGLEHPQQLPQAKKDDVKNAPDNELSIEDKEKSNASKYMIGAAALAGVIAIGIIGHKNNWWRKAQDIGEDLSKKGVDAASGGERKAGQTATPEAASAGSKADDIQTPKTDEKPSVEAPKVEPEVKKPVEEQNPVESPKQEEIPVEPPKPELKGVDLIKSNLESLDPKMGEEKVSEILRDTSSEINKLPNDNEKFSYFDDYSLMRLEDLFQIKKIEGASGYIGRVYVGDEKALEFRRTAFDLWTQNGGVTEKKAKRYLNDEYHFYDHIPACLKMSREEFLNIIKAAEKKD